MLGDKYCGKRKHTVGLGGLRLKFKQGGQGRLH